MLWMCYNVFFFWGGGCCIIRCGRDVSLSNDVLQDVCKSMLTCALSEIPRYPGEMTRVGLVIDGPTLDVLINPELQSLFLQLCRHSRAVLCCRATPLQKSTVVTLLRDRLKVMTLAIGKTLEQGIVGNDGTSVRARYNIINVYFHVLT